MFGRHKGSQEPDRKHEPTRHRRPWLKAARDPQGQGGKPPLPGHQSGRNDAGGVEATRSAALGDVGGRDGEEEPKTRSVMWPQNSRSDSKPG